MRKICKIKFSKTEKTNNLEAAMLKPHECYHLMILLKSLLWLNSGSQASF